MKRRFVLPCVFAGVVFLILFLQKNYFLMNNVDVNVFRNNKNGNTTKEYAIASNKQSEVKRISPGALLLVTQYRSGSSFVGEIFNQRRGVAYFYEPLYPLGGCPRNASTGVLEYFQSVIKRFDFSGAHELYKKMFPLSGRKVPNGCTTKGVCFAECSKCSQFLSRDTNICTQHGQQSCPNMNLTKVSEAVRKSTHIAFKVVYLCDFSLIKPILDDLELNVKIIHLVRDPRAVLHSRLRTSGAAKITKENSRPAAEHLCTHMNDLLTSAKNQLIHSDKYMMVRHEDMSLDPLKWTEIIYKFANITLNDEVINWLKKATSQQNPKRLSSSAAFSTTRNSADTIAHWRKESSFENAALVQSLCKMSMKELNYIPFNNLEDMRNDNIPSFLPLEM